MAGGQPSTSFAGQQLQHISTSELAEAFQQTLNLSPQKGEDLQPQQSHLNQVVGLRSRVQDHVIYSPSQHYTHSAHIANCLHPLQPAPHDLATRLLIQNDIKPSSLSRGQFLLFERADVDQRARLVMLWRLAPPSNPTSENTGSRATPDLADSTTIEREEQHAWERYQHLMAGKHVEQQAKSQDDGARDTELQDQEML